MKRALILSILVLCSYAFAQAPIPKEGFVPTAKEAIEIAMAVLEGMDGKIAVQQQGGFCADLKDGIWQVSGRCEMNPVPGRRGGGQFLMRIDKRTGQILGYQFNR